MCAYFSEIVQSNTKFIINPVHELTENTVFAWGWNRGSNVLNGWFEYFWMLFRIINHVCLLHWCLEGKWPFESHWNMGTTCKVRVLFNCRSVQTWCESLNPHLLLQFKMSKCCAATEHNNQGKWQICPCRRMLLHLFSMQMLTEPAKLEDISVIKHAFACSQLFASQWNCFGLQVLIWTWFKLLMVIYWLVFWGESASSKSQREDSLLILWVGPDLCNQ